MWQPDDDVDNCSCGSTFSMFNRKHHCRLCGQIFCHACASGRGDIPSFIQTRDEFLNVRLCDACLHECKETTKSEKIARALAIVPLDPKDIAKLYLNKRWHHASQILVNIIHNLPQKLPYQRFSRLEKQVLNTQAHFFKDNPKWAIQFVRALMKPPINKKILMAPHIFELLNTFPSTQLLRKPTIVEWLQECFRTMTTEQYILFMPHWLHRSMTPAAQTFIKDTIVPKCSNIRIAYSFYYECCLYKDPVYDDLKNYMLEKHHHHRKDIIYTDSLVQYVNELVQGNRFTVRLPAKLPYDPCTSVTAVLDPVKLNTATRPSTVLLKTNNGMRKILVKSDDLRKDRLVMLFSKFIEDVCNTKVVTYKVFPTIQGGWVEMLNDAKTLYELKFELSSHIHNMFPDNTIRCIRKRFIRSAVGACIVSYLLGVGDRHLQNMVISNGEIAHIDFSYLLGHDPKLQMDIRITPPMIIMMGGEHSKDYAFFVKRITDGFHKMRKYTGLWYALFTYLSEEFSLKEIQNHVKRKLMPCLQDAEATMKIVEIVKNNSNTWRHSVSDITHQIFQMDF